MSVGLFSEYTKSYSSYPGPFLGNNSTAAASAILPITSTTMANLGIPLTGSTAMGFTIGIMKG